MTKPLPARDTLVAFMIHTSRVTMMDPVTNRSMALDQRKPGSLGRFVNPGASLITLEGFVDE